ncbi:MAG: DUF2179 domain-containing protein [Spirochaetales bacterium]|nr:DUF2179 domain-containing protein [Spirochaetales bacterium]HNQ97415.1 DUF5698 domain-containing protein [Treponemataceae bacterium]
MFPLAQLLVALIIFVARVVDVSLATFRHAMIVRGRKAYALVVAFVESLIWIYAVSRVLSDLTEPVTALAFAAGFACGTWVGITIEDMLKIGEQVVRIFSAQGDSVSAALRDVGYRVTLFEGSGRDGPVQLLFTQVKRRDVRKVNDLARSIDPSCYLVIDDIRFASTGVHQIRT